MPRAVPTMLALAAGAGVMLALASCGGSDAKLLPGETAREITANLNTVNQLAAEGDCLGAENASRQVSEQVESLNVAAKLKHALSEGAERLNEVVAGCEEQTTEALTPTAAPPEPTEKPKKEEKEEEKEKKPKEEEAAPPPEHELPPQSNGKGKGLEKEPPEEEEEPEPEPEAAPPSGGVGPGSAVGEGD